MMKNTLRFCLTVLLLLQAAILRADVVTGRAVDAESGEFLPEAEVKVYIVYDMGMSWYTLKTDSVGRFFCKVAGDRCEATIDYPGYYTGKRSFMAEEGSDTLNLGDIRLRPSEVMLGSADVKARARRFTMRGDTVVFNPDAFNLPEGARLSELLEKLPGVTMKDGKLYWMDKPVRILMNGEELFADNQIVVDRLPVEAVDKIKAYNKASELAKRTGHDDGTEDNVLDIQVKPGFLERWYGSAAGTYQTTKRYNAKLDAMFLSLHDPMMAYVNWGNNGDVMNQRTFAGWSSGGGGTFNKQLFGALGYKHQWERMQGEKPLKSYITFSANANHHDAWDKETMSRETFFPGEDRTFSVSDSKTDNHMVRPYLNFRSEFQLDTMTYLNVVAEWEYTKTRNLKTDRDAVFDANPYDYAARPLDAAFGAALPDGLAGHLTTRSRYENVSDKEQMKTSYDVWLSRFFKRGKFTIGTRGSYYDEKGTDHLVRDIHYYRRPDADSHVLERRLNELPSHEYRSNINAKYEHTFGKDISLRIFYDFDHSDVFRKDRQYVLPEELGYACAVPLGEDVYNAVFDPTDSYCSKTVKNSHTLDFGGSVNLKKFLISPSLTFGYYREQLAYQRHALDTTAVRHVRYWTPSLTVRWKIRRGVSLESAYSYRPVDPRLLSTLDYTDSNDPLNIVHGNPLLKRSHVHDARLKFSGNIGKGQQSVIATIGYQRLVDPVSSRFTYDPQTGAYESMSVNVRGGDTWSGSLWYDRALGEFFRLSNNFSVNRSTSYSFLTRTDPSAGFVLNRARAVRISDSPYVGYETGKVAVGLHLSYAFQHRRNTQSYDWNNRLTDYSASIDARYKLPKWEFYTEVEFTGHDGYAMSTMNRFRILWNANVVWKVLSCATLSLAADDILNRDDLFYANVTANERTEQRFLNMHHYLRLTFTYNFDAKKAKAAMKGKAPR